MMAKGPWFPFGTEPEAPTRLLTLSHAGTDASVFRAWAREGSEGIAVCPVQPPGREVHLFVCGRPTPQVPPVRHEVADLPVTELAESLRELEGSRRGCCRITGRRNGCGPSWLPICQTQTVAGFRPHRPDGGHFAIFDRAAFVHAEIAGTVSISDGLMGGIGK